MIFFYLEHILTHISFSIISILISINLRTLLVDEITELSDSSKRGMITAFLCLTGFLVTRWIYLGHFPLSDLSDSLIFLSWSFFIIHIILKKKKNTISSITTISVIFTQGFATSGLLTQIHKSEKLVPALQSQWLLMHVSMIILGYASLLCGSLLSVALLAITFQKGIRIFVQRNELFSFNKLLSFVPIQNMNKKIQNFQSASYFSAVNFYKSQLIQQLDLWSYRVISVGFIFLTMGILSGAVWANEAWGSYWNWDPKETWAFITWTLFTIYLHTKTNKNLKVQNSAIMAFLGFIIIWICYFGVNLLEIGLHNYGSF